MDKRIGIAAIIFGIAALITAVGTAVVNFVTLKWAIKTYEPFGKIVEKSEPMMNKMVAYADKALDNYLEELED